MGTATTTSNTGMIVSLLLSVVCLVVMCMGGWYFLYSLVELRTLVLHQQEDIAGHRSEILEQALKIGEQSQIIHQLKEKLNEQDKQIDQILLQLEEAQLQVDNEEDINYNDTITTGHRTMKRQALPPPCTPVVGVFGPPGPKGDAGNPGLQGAKGDKGDMGTKGVTGKVGNPGVRGAIGKKGAKGDIGSRGAVGPRGIKGSDARAGGAVYVRWGHTSCPSTGAQLVYSGRAGGSHYLHKGGGADPQCLPLDPNFYRTQSGAQNRAYMYGAEIEGTNSFKSSSDDTDVTCAVCYVPTRSTVYMLPAKYTCPSGWTREYYGFLMSEHHDNYRTTFSCVDSSLTAVPGSIANINGLLFWPVEGVCGVLPCPPYDRNKELSCAVCTR